MAERWKKKERQLDRAEEEFFSRLRSAEAAEPDEKQRTSQDTVSGAVDESADAEAASPNRDVLGATPTDVAGGSSEAAKAGSDGGGPASPEGAEDIIITTNILICHTVMCMYVCMYISIYIYVYTWILLMFILIIILIMIIIIIMMILVSISSCARTYM